MEAHYEKLRSKLDLSKVEHKQRSTHISKFMRAVIKKFNVSNKNMKQTVTYFCSKIIQERFNSFLMDQRTEVGKIVDSWLVLLKSKTDDDGGGSDDIIVDVKGDEISLVDINIFVQKLIDIFCELYGLNVDGKDISAYSYREYCMRFIYPCVLNIPLVRAILENVVSAEKGRLELQSMSNDVKSALFCSIIKETFNL